MKSDLESYQGIKDASSQDGDRASFENQNIIGKKLYKAQNDILQLQKRLDLLCNAKSTVLI